MKRSSLSTRKTMHKLHKIELILLGIILMILHVRTSVRLLNVFVITPIKIMILFKVEKSNVRPLAVNVLIITIFRYMAPKTSSVPASTRTSNIKLIKNHVRSVLVRCFQVVGAVVVEPNLTSIGQSVKRDKRNKQKEELLGLNRVQ